ncbi:MAG: valine--tRNA ligase [Candidatus Magasanikbacteria bacterium]|nr:valine--tRNA ligase [Candidatus Magasanikbacteria bacterium]
MKELPKAYEPKQYEDGIYKLWETSGFFNPDVCLKKKATKKNAKAFSMVLPPPNVTGTLHMGHAVMLAIQDVMTRYHRMKGDRTLWVPGTDHAAVATESKVEAKLIKEEGMIRPKEELGRDKFLARVNQFAQESHDTIVNQAKKMGASLDWSREAFTLDAERNLAVRTMFKMMYDDGLIYRGYRVVNWSVKGQSTCSDDELVALERPAFLYTFTYGPECPIAIATTRPETKLGDTAIAVHPDGRWKKYIGQTFTIKNFGQSNHTLTLQVIGSTEVDDAFGTGALGVTPAHSPIDFDMYQKEKAVGNDIGLIQVIGESGKMVAGSDYVGLTVIEAREKVVTWLRTHNLLVGEPKEIVQTVSTSDRFGDVIEPLPKVQWFVDVNKKFVLKNSKLKGIKKGQKVSLKQLMQQVVKKEQIEIIPDRFNKTYFQWIDNLRDWCISRQIWYGHRVPVYYCKQEKSKIINHKSKIVDCGQPILSVKEITVCPLCGGAVAQDPDTLDTWFSSGLWTFSTLGWPDKKAKDFQTFHSTSVLETGYDILFFWVARMILMSTYALGDVPFKTVYLHGLVRDEQGRKMSKSLGNIIDPLDMIAKYGTDATRLSLMIGSTPGNDTKLSEAKVAGFRNFTNKLWNISRFMLLNIKKPNSKIQIPKTKTLADKWILARLSIVTKEVTKHLEEYNFSMAGELLRDFTWGDLADWYLEIAKIEGGKEKILNYILNTILKLWHPFMPYVTEAIWTEMYGKKQMLIVTPWPKALSSGSVKKIISDFSLVQDLITRLRAVRTEYKIEPVKKIRVVVRAGKYETLIRHEAENIMELARLESFVIGKRAEKPAGAVGFVEKGIEVFVDLAGTVDVAAEKTRLQKEIDTVAPYVMSLEKKLSNDGFVKGAPAVVVEGERKKLSEAKEKLEKLRTQFNLLVS